MGKIAFVFSGQGDQYPGMGKELCENYPAAADVFRMCDRIRPGTIEQCFTGSAEDLKQTKNTQPCLFAFELAAVEVLLEKGMTPNTVAGFSLGEVVAATVAGCFDHETGFRLVCKRGELMQAASEYHDTSMAAVVKLTAEQVSTLCNKYSDIYFFHIVFLRTVYSYRIIPLGSTIHPVTNDTVPEPLFLSNSIRMLIRCPFSFSFPKE